MPLHPVDQVPQIESPLPVAAAETPLYELLQVAPTADAAVVRAAYHALAQTYHPDRNRDPSAAEIMRALNHAHEILSDPRRRSMYDLKLRATQRLDRAASAHGVRRQTDCWRCHEPIDPLVAYCGVCHWLACPKCRACGCEHPEWRGLNEQPPRPGLVGGWALATIFALFSGVLLVTRPLPASVPPWLGQTGAGTPGSAPLSQNVSGPPSPRPSITPTDSTGPILLATSTLAVELTVRPIPVAQVAMSAPSPTPTTQPTAVLIAPTVMPTAAPRTALVATLGQGARLRAESNLSAPILEVLADGIRVIELGAPVDDADRTWWQVLVPSGNQGWVDARLLDPAAASEPELSAPTPTD